MIPEKSAEFARVWSVRLVVYLVLGSVAVLMLFPFIYMMSGSLKTSKDYQANPRRLLPYTQIVGEYNGLEAPVFEFGLNGETQEYIQAKITANENNRLRFFVFLATEEDIQRGIDELPHAEASNQNIIYRVEMPIGTNGPPGEVERGDTTVINQDRIDLFDLSDTIKLVNTGVTVSRLDSKSEERTYYIYQLEIDGETIVNYLHDGTQVNLDAYVDTNYDFVDGRDFFVRVTDREKDLVDVENEEEDYDVYEIYLDGETIGEEEDPDDELLQARRETIQIYVDRDDREHAIYASSLSVQPSEFIEFTLNNYDQVFNLQNLDRSLVNTAFVTILVVLGQATTSVFGGYAFSRIRFKGRNTIFVLYLGSIMIPFVVLIVPMFRLMVEIGWQDRIVSLIVPWIFTAYGTFLMRQFFITIPMEIEEAALLDGASRFRILWQIFIPLSTPAIATQSIFTFLYAWNSFIWPLVVINEGTTENHVLTRSLVILGNNAATQPNLVLAGAAVTILPPMIVFILAQKYFVEGIATSGLKG